MNCTQFSFCPAQIEYSKIVRMKSENQCKNDPYTATAAAIETRPSNNKTFCDFELRFNAFYSISLYLVVYGQLSFLRPHNTICSYTYTYVFLLATSNLYIMIESIDFIRPHVSTREYKIHDNIYGKKCVVIYCSFFFDDWIAALTK